MGGSRKRKSIGIETRREILHLLDGGMSQRQVAEELGVSRTTIRGSVERRAEYERETTDRKRLRPAKWPKMEMMLVQWTKSMRLCIKDPITPGALKHKARSLAALSQRYADFKASNGWVEGLMRRYPLRRVGKVQGNAAVPQRDVEHPALTALKDHLRSFKSCNVYCFGETSLLHSMVWKREWVMMEGDRQRVRGTQKEHRMVSLFGAVNADGTDLTPLGMVGSTENPIFWDREHVDEATVKPTNMEYFFEKHGWINDAVFEQWFRSSFVSHVRKWTSDPVVLLVDSYGTYNTNLSQDQVTIMPIPSTCVNVCSPLDMGIFARLRQRYRRAFMQEWLDMEAHRKEKQEQFRHLDRVVAGLKHGFHPSLADVARLSVNAWFESTGESIIDCWVRSGLLPREHETQLRSSWSFSNKPRETEGAIARDIVGLLERHCRHEDVRLRGVIKMDDRALEASVLRYVALEENPHVMERILDTKLESMIHASDADHDLDSTPWAKQQPTSHLPSPSNDIVDMLDDINRFAGQSFIKSSTGSVPLALSPLKADLGKPQ